MCSCRGKEFDVHPMFVMCKKEMVWQFILGSSILFSMWFEF